MAEEKKKRVNITSPVGVAKFPHLSKPQTSINNKVIDPVYGVTLLVDPNDADVSAFVAKVEQAHAAAFAEAKKKKRSLTDMGLKNVIREEVRKDEEDNEIPTGKLEIRFKAKACGKRKDGTPWSFKPWIYDARLTPMPEDTMVYGGSVIQVSFAFKHTAMETGSFYTSLDLQAVKVVVLKSQSDRDAASFGFQAEPGSEDAGATPLIPMETFTALRAASTAAGAGDSSEAQGAAPASGADF